MKILKQKWVIFLTGTGLIASAAFGGLTQEQLARREAIERAIHLKARVSQDAALRREVEESLNLESTITRIAQMLPPEASCDVVSPSHPPSLSILNPSPDLVGKVFSLDELKEITQFKHLGGGGEGAVFQIKTKDGKEYAMKIYMGSPAKAGMKYSSWSGPETVKDGEVDKAVKGVRATYGENLPKISEQTPGTIRLYRVGFAWGEDLHEFSDLKSNHTVSEYCKTGYLCRVEIMELGGKEAGGLSEEEFLGRGDLNKIPEFSDTTPAIRQLLKLYDYKTLHEYFVMDQEKYNAVITPTDKIERFGKKLSDFDYWKLTFLDRDGKTVHRYVPRSKMIEQWVDYSGSRQKVDHGVSEEERTDRPLMKDKYELKALEDTLDLESPPPVGSILDLRTGEVSRGH